MNNIPKSIYNTVKIIVTMGEYITLHSSFILSMILWCDFFFFLLKHHTENQSKYLHVLHCA